MSTAREGERAESNLKLAAYADVSRPDLSELSCVNPRLRQGWKATKLGDIAQAADVWHAVRQAVLAQGCELGVRAAIPPVQTPSRPWESTTT